MLWALITSFQRFICLGIRDLNAWAQRLRCVGLSDIDVLGSDALMSWAQRHYCLGSKTSMLSAGAKSIMLGPLNSGLNR